jgi:uncharacterized protein
LFHLVIEEKIIAITSPILLSELKEVFSKKFSLSESYLRLTIKNLEKRFLIIHPKREIKFARDEDDNRVLEAAVEGKCDYIISGDKDLLDLGKYKNIIIVTPDMFLKIMFSN